MRHLGRLEELSPEVQAAIQRACRLTRNNRKMVFSFAFNYGGRTEIIDAVRHLIQEKATEESITDDAFKSHLYAPDIPDVDLLIRTSGELRISNFLLWQAAYAELYFSKVLWPDFTPGQIKKALEAYSARQRRFGGIKKI